MTPVIGMPGVWVAPVGEATTEVARVVVVSVTLTVGDSTAVAVSAVAVTPPSGVLVGSSTVRKVTVGVACCPAQAVVNSMRITAPVKKKCEVLIISLTPKMFGLHTKESDVCKSSIFLSQ